MKTMLMLAFCLITPLSFAASYSQSAITAAQLKVQTVADSYFGKNNHVAYTQSSVEDKEIFFYVYWTEVTNDLYFDEGEPIFSPQAMQCEQEMVYLVDEDKVLLSQNGNCY